VLPIQVVDHTLYVTGNVAAPALLSTSPTYLIDVNTLHLYDFVFFLSRSFLDTAPPFGLHQHSEYKFFVFVDIFVKTGDPGRPVFR